MATRGKGGAMGGGGVWPVYEDFKPNSEWQQDAHSHNLIISIPGFMKEQLRVLMEGRNIIRVRGQRLIGGNKWSRFLEDFEVPENSDMNSVQAKFHEGTLTITIPKKIVDKPHKFAPEEKKGVETHKDKKQDHVDDRSKEAGSSKTKQTRVDRAEAELEKTVMKEDKNSEIGKELGKDEMAASKIKLKMDGAAAKEKGKEDKRKEVMESSGAEHGAFTKGLAAKDMGKEGKMKEVIESSGAEHGAFKKVVKGLTKLNEERQLMMVSIGVAVLVIALFSAYVTYKFVAGDDKKWAF